MTLPRAAEVRRLRLLVADDDGGFCAAAGAALAESELVQVVGCARDGEQALALARLRSADVVLLGDVPPLLDGTSFAEQLRELRPQPVVVVLTGGEGRDAFAPRPVGASVLLEKDAALCEHLDLMLVLASLSASAAEDEQRAWM